MSFGWSAGDIAQAVAVIVKVVKALDDANGAPADYRKAVTFLEGVKRTLQQLHFFTKLGKYPAYGDEIRRHVEQIKDPLGKFLSLINKYEPSLGPTRISGRWRSMYRKLTWEYSDARKVLKKEIKDDLDALNRLLHLFTLDVLLMVNKEQNRLPDDLRQEFANLTAILEQHLVTLEADLQVNRREGSKYHSEVLSQLESYHRVIRQEHLQPIQNEIKAFHFEGKENHLRLSEKLDHLSVAILGITRTTSGINPRLSVEDSGEALGSHGTENGRAGELAIASTRHDIRALLDEVFYMMFLCIAKLLQKFFRRLAAPDQPSRALTCKLLSIYNITFQDALGRPARVLQYEVFSNFKMFQTFLQESFSTIPGRKWVELGSFLLTNTSVGKTLTAKNWSRSIFRGCYVYMDMLIHLPKAPAQGDGCFIAECQGILQQDESLLALSQVPNRSLKCNICLRNCVDANLPTKSKIGQASIRNVSHVHVESQEEPSRLSLVSEEDVKKFQRFAQKSTSEEEPNGPKPIVEESEINAEEPAAQNSTGEQVNDYVLSEDEANTPRPMLNAMFQWVKGTDGQNHLVWYCSNCGDGPMLVANNLYCYNCVYQRSADSTIQWVRG